MTEMPDVHAGPPVKLGRDIKARVGQQLRVMYGAVVDQGVPDRCIEILRRLDEPGQATGE